MPAAAQACSSSGPLDEQPQHAKPATPRTSIHLPSATTCESLNAQMNGKSCSLLGAPSVGTSICGPPNRSMARWWWCCASVACCQLLPLLLLAAESWCSSGARSHVLLLLCCCRRPRGAGTAWPRPRRTDTHTAVACGVAGRQSGLRVRGGICRQITRCLVCGSPLELAGSLVRGAIAGIGGRAVVGLTQPRGGAARQAAGQHSACPHS